MARFIPFYTDPAKRGLQRIQIAVVLVLLPVALFFGIPAAREYMAFQAAADHLVRADELTHEGRDTEALVELEKCVEIYPGFYQAYELMAALHYDRQDRSKAIDSYERGLKALPDHGELHYGIAQMLFLEKRYGEALDHARKAQAALPGDVRSAHLIERCEDETSRASS